MSGSPWAEEGDASWHRVALVSSGPALHRAQRWPPRMQPTPRGRRGRGASSRHQGGTSAAPAGAQHAQVHLSTLPPLAIQAQGRGRWRATGTRTRKLISRSIRLKPLHPHRRVRAESIHESQPSLVPPCTDRYSCRPTDSRRRPRPAGRQSSRSRARRPGLHRASRRRLGDLRRGRRTRTPGRSDRSASGLRCDLLERLGPGDPEQTRPSASLGRPSSRTTRPLGRPSSWTSSVSCAPPCRFPSRASWRLGGRGSQTDLGEPPVEPVLSVIPLNVPGTVDSWIGPGTRPSWSQFSPSLRPSPGTSTRPGPSISPSSPPPERS